MSLEQTVEIPLNHQLFVAVPPEVPVGKAILTFTPLSVSKDLKNAGGIWAVNRERPEELKAKLQNLQGRLGKAAYGGMDGATYQRKIREESIENETIALSRSTKLKLPDAIIGATAIVYGAEMVTRDPHFLECQYEKLQVWKGN